MAKWTLHLWLVKDTEIGRWTWIIWVGPKHNHKCSYTMRQREILLQAEKKVTWWRKKRFEWCTWKMEGVTSQSTGESWKGKETDCSLRASEETSPEDTFTFTWWKWFQMSDLQNCRRVNLCFKPQSLWWLVTIATES